MNDNFRCILLMTSAEAKIVPYGDRAKYLPAENSNRALYWLIDYYDSMMICADFSQGQEKNEIASKIAKRDIHGNCIIVDNEKNLGLNDLTLLLQLSKHYERINNWVCKNYDDYLDTVKKLKEIERIVSSLDR